jgi:hypothetical protein
MPEKNYSLLNGLSMIAIIKKFTEKLINDEPKDWAFGKYLTYKHEFLSDFKIFVNEKARHDLIYRHFLQKLSFILKLNLSLKSFDELLMQAMLQNASIFLFFII